MFTVSHCWRFMCDIIIDNRHYKSYNMLSFMHEYITPSENSQYFVYNSIRTGGKNHNGFRNLVLMFHGLSVILADFSRRVNDFRSFHACNSEISTGGATVLSGVWAANWLFDASPARSNHSRSGMAWNHTSKIEPVT